MQKSAKLHGEPKLLLHVIHSMPFIIFSKCEYRRDTNDGINMSTSCVHCPSTNTRHFGCEGIRNKKRENHYPISQRVLCHVDLF